MYNIRFTHITNYELIIYIPKSAIVVPPAFHLLVSRQRYFCHSSGRGYEFIYTSKNVPYFRWWFDALPLLRTTVYFCVERTRTTVALWLCGRQVMAGIGTLATTITESKWLYNHYLVIVSDRCGKMGLLNYRLTQMWKASLIDPCSVNIVSKMKYFLSQISAYICDTSFCADYKYFRFLNFLAHAIFQIFILA